MRKIYLTLMAAAGLVFTSCSSDEPLMDGNNGYQDGKVSFLVELPDNINSRAMADGLSARELTYVVYDNEGNFLFQETEADAFTSREANVSIPLVKDKSYKVAFFAKNSAAPYTITDGTLNIDYTNAQANNDIYDAFYKMQDVAVSATMSTQEVQLKRPFGQLNVGATDWAAAKKAGYTVEKTGLSFSAQVYTSMNLLNGEVSNEEEVTFNLNTLPDVQADNTPVKLVIDGAEDKYDYVASAYVLMPTDQSIVNAVSFNYAGPKGEVKLPINNVPMQRNYRTNILGQFFTSDVEYHIVIDQYFTNTIPHEVVEYKEYNGETFKLNHTPWDGSSEAELVRHKDGTIVICSAAQLAQLAKTVNEASPATRAGNSWNCVLLLDIDLGKYSWTPIGAYNPGDLGNGHGFQGSFDGMGHTVKNIYVNFNDHKNMIKAGLFGNVGGAGIKNLHLENVKIDGLTTDDGQRELLGAGALAGYVIPGAVIDGVSAKGVVINANRQAGGIIGAGYASVTNCSVDGLELTVIPNKLSNGTYDNGDKVGGIAGHITEDPNKQITGNTVKNAVIKGYRDLGGLCGLVNNASDQVKNNTVENVKIIACSSYTYSGHMVGENTDAIVGRKASGLVIDSSNKAITVDISAAYEVSTQAEFAALLPKITAQKVNIKLGPGLFQFAGGVVTPISATASGIQGGHEAQDAIKFNNMYEGMDITIEGSGNSTCIIMSDGNWNAIPSGGVSLLVNKANFTFKKMMQVRRYHGLLDAKVEKYENCLIYGNVQARSETVEFDQCEFTTLAMNHNIDGLGTLPNTNTALFYGGYFRHLKFNDCTFKADQPKAIQIYPTYRWNVKQDITATNCTLYGGATRTDNKSRAFFEVHGELGVHGTINLTNCKINSSDESNWAGGLWTNHFSSSGNNFTVIVDGQTKVTSDWKGSWENVWDGKYL